MGLSCVSALAGCSWIEDECGWTAASPVSSDLSYWDPEEQHLCPLLIACSFAQVSRGQVEV